jgi:MerR family transcriptional regulator, light-induced transcriptional regulator
MNSEHKLIRPEGLKAFSALQKPAELAFIERLRSEANNRDELNALQHAEGIDDDIVFQLEFLRLALEFGFIQPMVEYLIWLRSTLTARSLPVQHLALSTEWLSEFFSTRMSAEDGQFIVSVLNEVKQKFLLAGDVLPPQVVPPEVWPETESFEQALLAGRQSDAFAIVSNCLAEGQHLIDIEIHLIQPALYRIGEKWQANQISVVQEHLATAIAQMVMTMGLLRSPAPVDKSYRRVLLACVQGNQHCLGLRMVADAFQLSGWEVHYLGADVPTSDIVSYVIDWKPDLIGLSVAFPHQLRMVKRMITALTAIFGDARPAVLLGGLAINRFESLAGYGGATFCASDARQAVILANELSPDEP